MRAREVGQRRKERERARA
jgi:hypothetical protein